jgi:hypothetical protein
MSGPEFGGRSAALENSVRTYAAVIAFRRGSPIYLSAAAFNGEVYNVALRLSTAEVPACSRFSA